jgi:hypothetical protein
MAIVGALTWGATALCPLTKCRETCRASELSAHALFCRIADVHCRIDMRSMAYSSAKCCSESRTKSLTSAGGIAEYFALCPLRWSPLVRCYARRRERLAFAWQVSVFGQAGGGLCRFCGWGVDVVAEDLSGAFGDERVEVFEAAPVLANDEQGASGARAAACIRPVPTA